MGYGFAPFLFGAPIGVLAGAYPRFIAPGYAAFPPWGFI
jgi:hypothetical protein